MNKLFLGICLCMVMMSCDNASKTQENKETPVDTIMNPADGTASVETQGDKPLATIVEDSDLDSITKRLVRKGIERYRKRWINVLQDSAGFYLFQPNDGQTPYVEITKENEVYLLVLGEPQMLWYGAILDFNVTDPGEMIVRIIPWNPENKRYGSDEDYKPKEYHYSTFSKEKGIIQKEADYFLEAERVEKEHYRIVREEEQDF